MLDNVYWSPRIARNLSLPRLGLPRLYCTSKSIHNTSGLQLLFIIPYQSCQPKTTEISHIFPSRIISFLSKIGKQKILFCTNSVLWRLKLCIVFDSALWQRQRTRSISAATAIAWKISRFYCYRLANT